jgi:DNA-binding PadR family transcriptional regulator
MSDAKKPIHGYEIKLRLEKRSQNMLAFPDGLIYPALNRMENKKLLEGTWTYEPGERVRKVYVITDEGKKLLREQIKNWEELIKAMNLLLYTNSEPSEDMQ